MINENKLPVFTVIGSGNGGMAMAGHLALMGFKVNFYNRTEGPMHDILELGGIWVKGLVEGFGGLNIITSDIKKAIEGSDIIMVVVPATGHRDIANLIAPYINSEQIVVLNPGRTGGALEFRNILTYHGVYDVTVAEAQTFMYASRKIAPTEVRIFGIKNAVQIACIPANDIDRVVSLLGTAYPQFEAVSNVLETSLNNIGAIFHPAPTLLNCGRIESTLGDFNYYTEGVTPAVATILEKMDEERINVARALGVRTTTALEWLKYTYGSEGEDLYEAISTTKSYCGIKAPQSLNTRYIFEDVPESLVPMSSLGRMLGVHTPTINSIIYLCSTMHGIDYWGRGRTVDKLGLKGLTVEEIYNLIIYGEAKTTEGEVVA
jgi:opine dehydrogenase